MSMSKTILAFALAISQANFIDLSTPAFSQDARAGTGAEGSKHIRSLKEIRGEGVVRQRWDISCGAAALSTILTYDFKDNTPETAIVVWLLHRLDARRVRARGGFSLLDLKHFAEARGYNAEGFSGMSIEELAQQKTSVIVPIRVKGFDHFIVIRGIQSGRVLIADPGFGNLTMTVDRFKSLWKGGIVFIVHPPDDRMITKRKLAVGSQLVPDETVITREITIVAPSVLLY
jgi:uncharacterized protein